MVINDNDGQLWWSMVYIMVVIMVFILQLPSGVIKRGLIKISYSVVRWIWLIILGNYKTSFSVGISDFYVWGLGRKGTSSTFTFPRLVTMQEQAAQKPLVSWFTTRIYGYLWWIYLQLDGFVDQKNWSVSTLSRWHWYYHSLPGMNNSNMFD
jgi:hypothetical protein